MRGQRQHWIATPRWALKMPFGRFVDPDERNSAATSEGSTVAIVASTSASGTPPAMGEEARPGFDPGGTAGVIHGGDVPQERKFRR